jgi:hypothetical protein
MNFIWKILELESLNGVPTKAKYHVTAIGVADATVETEGYWTFSNTLERKPFADITEADIAEWIQEETTINGVCHIKSNLEKQLENSEKSTDLPWKPSTFKVA